MPRFASFAVLLTTTLLYGCPQEPQLSTETGIALGGGGDISPAATEYRDYRRIGPGKPEYKWMYELPPEAEMTSSSIPINYRAIPQVAVGHDGTAYFTACALPAAREEMAFIEEAHQRFYDDYQNKRQPGSDETMESGSMSARVGSLVANAPKEDWLFAVSPVGELMWVFKAPGAPVGMPMISSGGDIVIGTYGIHARDFNKDSSTRDDPREHCGGIFVIRPNGELFGEIDPGGWLDWIMLGPDDTLICRISDEGDEYYEENRRDVLCLKPDRLPPPYRYVAVDLEGEFLWEKDEELFNLIDSDHGGMFLAELADGIYFIDPLTGDPAGLYRAPDPRTAEWGWSEFGEDGVLYSVDCEKTVIMELIAGDITLKEANHSVPLAKYDRGNNKLWEVLAGMGVMDLTARPDGRLLVIRSLAVYDSLAPYSFRDECKLICLDENGEVAWSYLDDMIGQLWTITLDEEMNCYIVSNGRWNLANGIVSLDKDGKVRWKLPNDRMEARSGITFGPGGMMYVVSNDVAYAYGESATSRE